MSMWWVIQALSLPLCAIAAVTDHRTGRIPNWLTLPGLVLAPLCYGIVGGLSALGFSIFGAAACALVPYILFRKQACGGGDVKLLALLGAIGGATFGVEAQLFSFTIATLFVIGRMVYEGRALRFFGNSLRVVTNPVLPGRFQRPVGPEMLTPIRLGLPILGGACVAVLVRAPFFGW